MSDPRPSRLPPTHVVERPVFQNPNQELEELRAISAELLFQWHFIRNHLNLHPNSPLSQTFGRLGNIIRPTDVRFNYHLRPGPLVNDQPTVIMDTELTPEGERFA